jgi:LmbE family N-acetylglucosaminyl deacetylase
LPTRLMHVVAHEDDDLLFMNPDLSSAIRAGDRTVTVFVTAGQLSGEGNTEGERARNRQRGIQDAYARMAGVPTGGAQAEWVGDLLPCGGKLVERYRLAGTDVQVVFVGLRDGGMSTLYAGTPHFTVVTTGGLGAPQYRYGRADLLSVLSELVELYQPAQVRALDPLPETRYTADHADHTAVAKFVADVNPVAPVVAYRGYSLSDLPQNLEPGVAADKLATYDAYRVHDHAAGTLGFPERMYHRWPTGVSWVGSNADGRLELFAVRGGELWTWWQTLDGQWSQPRTLGGAGGPLAPTVAVARNLDGRIQVFGRRLSDHRIVSVWQTVPNSTWLTVWADLGNHNAGLPSAGQMGTPGVARNADGRLQLFVKNGGGGVSTKSQTSPGGSWGAWVDLGGTDVQDGTTAVLGPSGRIEMFAATRDRILHWYQTAPNSAFTANPTLPSMVPASPPTAVLDQGGRIRVAYRRAGGTDVAVSVQVIAGSSWSQPVAARGPGGSGQLAAAAYAGGVQLFGRDAGGGVSVAPLSPGGAPGPWDGLDGVADCPAVVTDPGGGLRVFADGDGRLAHRSWPAESAWTPLT